MYIKGSCCRPAAGETGIASGCNATLRLPSGGAVVVEHSLPRELQVQTA